MASPKASIVLTTINDPVLLDGYQSNLTDFGHLDYVDVIVIPDRKTVPEAYQRCRELGSRGLHIKMPSLEEQESFLRSVGLTPSVVPFNSDNRRNVGYLMALAAGSDFIISLDDDNYCRPGEDNFSQFAKVLGDATEFLTAEETTPQFYNICDHLVFEKPAPVYARGFPYYARHSKSTLKSNKGAVPILINAGLWVRDPDVDGITWLTMKPRVCGSKEEEVILGSGVWSPINTQNTSLRRDVIPAYYFIRMGYQIGGVNIDRYGDIFSGYFAEACVKSQGAAVRFGSPVADHRRNSHNYLIDATNEWACILLLEDLLPWLTDVRLTGSTPAEAYLALSYLMEDAVETMHGRIWTDATRAYFHQMAYYMRLWLSACKSCLN